MNKSFKRICLDGEWSLFIASHEDVCNKEYSTLAGLESANILKLKGSVPGNFELDMQKAGLLDDVFFGMNPLKLQDLEDKHLWYARKFSFDGGQSDTEKVFLFEGIDTFSEIYLNGNHIGSTDNMMVEFEISADGLIKGENELVVHIIPALAEARKHPNELCSYSKYRNESLYIRKAAHTYGWDIMVRALSGGIWKSVFLVEKPCDRLEDIYLYTRYFWEDKAYLRCYYTANLSHTATKDYALRISGVCKDSSFSHTERLWHNSGPLDFTFENYKLWWTRDMGDSNLYDVTVELLYKGETVDTYNLNFGIRKITLERTSLAVNGEGKFCLYLNGKPFFARGTNWVPLDAFHSRDKERLPKALDLLYDIGCNIVRCWGGNVYEPDEFFDFCDRNGIAVWQDFSMACAAYPQDEYFCSALRRECEKVIKRLRNHASLLVWAGDNECDEAISNPPFYRNPNKNKLTREVIPELLYSLDPLRPYLPSSPYMDDEAISKGMRDHTTEQHVWGPRDYFKGKYYATNQACFASETGYHGCNSPESVKRFISEDKLWPWQDNKEWLVHAACMVPDATDPYAYRIPLMAQQVKTLFGDGMDNLSDFALASQISQGEAMKYFIEKYRMDKGYRTGIIWWNLIDGWPQFSDAIVDYYYIKKLAYHYIKNSQNPVCLMMSEPENGVSKVIAANEHLYDVNISYSIKKLSDGQTAASGKASLKENAATNICTVPADAKNREVYLIKWKCEDGSSGVNHYTCAEIPYDFEWYKNLMEKTDFWILEGF